MTRRKPISRFVDQRLQASHVPIGRSQPFSVTPGKPGLGRFWHVHPSDADLGYVGGKRLRCPMEIGLNRSRFVQKKKGCQPKGKSSRRKREDRTDKERKFTPLQSSIAQIPGQRAKERPWSVKGINFVYSDSAGYPYLRATRRRAASKGFGCTKGENRTRQHNWGSGVPAGVKQY